MFSIPQQTARVERMCRNDIMKRIGQLNISPVVSAPRNARGSTSFVIRLRNDASDADTDSVLKIVRETVSQYNQGFKFENQRLRMIKRGRKPVQGAKYSYGGMLKLSEATEIDVYVMYEYV